MVTSRNAQSWALALTATASLMVALDALVVATALSTIRRDLHASLSTLEWTVNAYGLSFAVLLMSGAALGDRFGRRRVFIVGLGVFMAGSAGCALAPTVGWLILARVVQGVGSALVMPLAMALLAAAIPPERRGAALGIFSAITGLAVVGGPLVGGFISQTLAWQWIFWLNVPIGAAVIPLVLARIEESYGPRTRPDVVGVALVSAATLGLVWGLIRANTVGWGSTEVVVVLVTGTVSMIAFVQWELRVDGPMLPMRFFADRGFAAGNASAFLLYASLYGMVFYIAQYLQVALGYSPLAAGLRFLPWTALMFVVAPLSGRLADRIGGRPLIAAGLTLQAVGAGWIATNAADGRSYASSIIALMISGVGLTMAMPAVQVLVLGAVPPSALGKASGTFNTVRQLGGVFGVAALAAAFSANGSYASPRAFASGSGAALAVAAAFAGMGALLALCAPARARGLAAVTAAQPVAVPEPAHVS